jgi:hypothetical protein
MEASKVGRIRIPYLDTFLGSTDPGTLLTEFADIGVRANVPRAMAPKSQIPNDDCGPALLLVPLSART